MINKNIVSMSMKLKPSKCRSFSLSSGKPVNIPFHIDDTLVPSIQDEEQKFLGKLLFFSGKSIETFNHIKDSLKQGIENIEKSFIRDEYKLWIYKEFFVPSKRFLLTVHTITDSHLKKLDTFTDKYVKKWAGLPPCATNALIHMNKSMNVKSISAVYMEAHSVSHTRTRILGDENVNYVINCSLQRENQYTRKSSTLVQAEANYLQSVNKNSVQGTVPSFLGENNVSVKRKFYNQVKGDVMATMSVSESDK